MSEDYAHLLHRGSGGSMYTRKAHAHGKGDAFTDEDCGYLLANDRASWLTAS